MKKNDLAIIIMIASTSAILTYVVATQFVSKITQQSTTVLTIEKIDSELVEPDATIFNKEAINPAVQVNIDKSSGQ